MTEEMEIPEDLREWYVRAPNPKSMQYDLRVKDPIERLSRAEQRVKELEQENERLKAPLSDEEAITNSRPLWNGDGNLVEAFTRQQVNALITARAASNGEHSTKKYCSRSCASAGSVTDARRNAVRFGNIANLNSPAKMLKKRESWKYTQLESALSGVPHEFEYDFGGYVYDLFLPEFDILVEFDDKYHCGKQKITDHIKDVVAKLFGYSVVRVRVESASVIPASVLNFAYDHARQCAA